MAAEGKPVPAAETGGKVELDNSLTPMRIVESNTWTVICSPVSGKKQGRSFVETKLVPALNAKGIKHVVLFTERFQHAKQLAKGRSKIICVGGDGTANEVLESCPQKSTVAIVSQGTMNFFGVCADLPQDAGEIADLISRGSSRPCSMMKVCTSGGADANAISFEALHIGHMPYNVCKGAQDYRFSMLGPMFGIASNLVVGNADPKTFKQRGTLQFWPLGGGPLVRVKDDFFWIIITYRNPYNGVVGNDLWVSWMTLETFPGFGRMMKFFEPQMEHFQGTSRCFGCHAKVSRVEFAVDESVHEGVALVLDGDPKECGRSISVDHQFGAFNVVASEEPPQQVNTNRIAVGGGPFTPKPLTKFAKAWLTMYPPPKGTAFPEPLPMPAEAGEGVNKLSLVTTALFIALVIYVRRHPPT